MVQQFIILFASEKNAIQLVAGIPAAARALRNTITAASPIISNAEYIIALPGGVISSKFCHLETSRLVPEPKIEVVDSNILEPSESAFLIDGSELPDPALLAAVLQGKLKRHDAFPHSLGDWRIKVAGQNATDRKHRLNRLGWNIIRATVKSGDGIVSRYVNRPISTRMTRLLLRFGWVRPIHATLAAAFVGLSMAWCLFFGGSAGLLVGGVLFQIASIIDGVDGEMARATLRSSDRGATLDSVIDSVTNLFFFAGLSFNLSQQGVDYAGIAGTIGFSAFALGLILLGAYAYKVEGSINFEAVKRYFRGRGSASTQVLIWLTTRDFFVASSCVFVVAGMAALLLYLFAAIAVTWFLVVIIVLLAIQIKKIGDGNPRR